MLLSNMYAILTNESPGLTTNCFSSSYWLYPFDLWL